MVRAIRSSPLPAAKVTTKVTGRVGHSCAQTESATIKRPATAITGFRLDMHPPIGPVGFQSAKQDSCHSDGSTDATDGGAGVACRRDIGIQHRAAPGREGARRDRLSALASTATRRSRSPGAICPAVDMPRRPSDPGRATHGFSMDRGFPSIAPRSSASAIRLIVSSGHFVSTKCTSAESSISASSAYAGRDGLDLSKPAGPVQCCVSSVTVRTMEQACSSCDLLVPFQSEREF